jgi:SNF2 family DNA or RNA helicase
MKTLYPHQELGIACMNTTDNLGLFYEPGTGKTIMALTWILGALKDCRIADALIVAPASLVANWEKDIEEATQFDHITEDDVKMLKRYVTIRSYQKLYRTSTDKITERRKIYLREDMDKHWGAIIVDESQGLGGHSSVQTKVCLAMAQLADYRYILTGTPVNGSTKTGGEDLSKLYGQFKFLRPNIWKNWTEWCKKYVLAYDKFYKPIKYDVEALHKIMNEMAISVRLRDCIDLPEEIRSNIPCPLMEQRAYKEIRSGATEKYGFEIKTAGGQFTKLLQLCSGSLKTDAGVVNKYTTSKDDALKELLTDNPEPIVIFCLYTASVNRCYEIAKSIGRNPVKFAGPSKKPTWMQFADGTYDTIVIQYAKGGKGLNLQNSGLEILYEPCFSSDHLKQSLSRITRPGQTKICRFMFLYTPSTVEQKVLESVQNGQDVVAATFRKWSEEGSI